MTTAIRIEAFTESERGKLVQPEASLVDWTIRGTSLVATVPWLGVSYEVEVETTYNGLEIESWSVDVYRLEPVEFVSGGGPYVVIDGAHHKKRYLTRLGNERLFETLHRAVDEFLQDHSYSVCVAWDRELAEERADDARDFEQGIGC